MTDGTFGHMLQVPHQLPPLETKTLPASESPTFPNHSRKRPPQKNHGEPSGRLKLEEPNSASMIHETSRFRPTTPPAPSCVLSHTLHGVAVMPRYTWRPAARSLETTKLTASPARVPYVRCGARMSRLPVQTASPTLQMMRVLSLGKLGIWPRSCGQSCQLSFRDRFPQARETIPAGSWCRQR